MRKELLHVDLQLFAEGVSAGDGATVSGEVATELSAAGKSKKSNPLADVKYGITEEVQSTNDVTESLDEPSIPEAEENLEQDPQVETKERIPFDDLIKGDYKKDFDDRVQEIIKKRFKESDKQNDANMQKLAPVLQVLGNKYGIDASDISKIDMEKLTNTILEDDSFYEQEAIKRGMSVSNLKEIKRMERENSELKRIMDEKQKREQGERAWQQVLQQAEQVKQIYPSFNVEDEMRNERFGRLVASGVDLQTAFEVTHKNELQPAAMQLVAQKTAQKVVNSIQANSHRPSENGVTTSASTTISKTDPRQLTKADREEIRQRVARGEKIRF